MKTVPAIFLLLVAAPALAQFRLSAESEPVNKAWEFPATVAYTRNGDGTSNATIDANLSYEFRRIHQVTGNLPAMADAIIGAVYIHRDNADASPRNDRGVSLGYTRQIVWAPAISGINLSTWWIAKISAGKTLQQISEDPATKVFADRTKDREKLSLRGLFRPASNAWPPPPSSQTVRNLPRQGDMYFHWELGLYSDHSSGGNGRRNGRLSGVSGALEWTILPLGVIAASNRVGDYGVVPVVTLLAQVQHDLSATGSLDKLNYHLYAATLSLEFKPILVDGATTTKITPSINITRSIGADLLTGRSFIGKTEVALGLSF